MEKIDPKTFVKISDSEIEAVVGGVSKTDSVMLGDRVKAADGKVCPNCGGAIGRVEMLNYVTKVVKCEKCGKHIISFNDSGKVVKV